jgi:NAD(P)-dependent dehydrogenase (short-subunit alcohol dehydrogenase family)
MDVPRVVLITGASTGIGKACAEFLSHKGYRVYGTSRRSPEPPAPARAFTMIRMDVTDTASVQRGVDLIVQREGRIDAVLNNAGAALVGPIEDISILDAETNIQTNFFGALRVCKAVIPLMRAAGGGCIINMSSVAGVLSLPYQGIYGAGKFALEGMTEALRVEVRHFGIRVSLIEPGDIRTQDCRSRIFTTSAYEPWFSRAVKLYEADEQKGYPPEKIGPLVARIIASRNPKLRYSFGRTFQSLVPFLKRVTPQRLAQWIFCLMYKT